MPRISFIMAAYNAEPYIEAAIQSALAQEGVTLEVLVVDDASTDRTAEVVDACTQRDDRVRLIRQSQNAGPSAARNVAIAQAKGDWLAILDADDIIEPKRASHLLELAEITGADIMADNLIRFDGATGQELSTSLTTGPADYAFMVTPATYLHSNVLLGRTFALGYLKPMISTSFLHRHRIEYDTTVRLGEDFLFCLEALFNGARYVVSARPHYLYRVQRGSQSHRLSGDHVEQLARSFEELISRTRIDDDMADAVGAYRHGLDRARAYVSMIEGLKRRAYVGSLRIAASRPDTWPLIGRYGLEFVLKRLAGLARPLRKGGN